MGNHVGHVSLQYYQGKPFLHEWRGSSYVGDEVQLHSAIGSNTFGDAAVNPCTEFKRLTSTDSPKKVVNLSTIAEYLVMHHSSALGARSASY